MTVLIAHNVTSILVAIACWWLAHQYARLTPPGRSISICLRLLRIGTLSTLLARNLGGPQDVMAITSKGILALSLFLIIIRHSRKGDD